MEFRDCYRHYVPGIDEATLDACEIAHRRIFATTRLTHPPVLYPYVMETLQTLRDRGVTMAIASSRSSEELRQLLSDLHIAPFFSVVIGGEQVTHVKPDPEAVLRIFDTLSPSSFHFSPSSSLVVGDMEVDIRMGINAHTSTCAVTYGYGHLSDGQRQTADYCIDRFDQLLSL